MWGEFVHRAGVGPKPTPVTQLTADILVDKLRELTSTTIRETAVALSGEMNAEQGVVNAMDHFWAELPRDSMMCSLGLIMGKSLLAKYRIKGHDIPISQEVASVLMGDDKDGLRIHTIPLGNNVQSLVQSMAAKVEDVDENIVPYGTTTYALRHRGGYDTFSNGLFTILLELGEGIALTILQFLIVPDRYARKRGLLGCIVGLVVSPLYFAYHSIWIIITFVDRLGVDIANNIFGKHWLYLIDSSAQAKVYRDVESLSSSATGNKVSDESILYMTRARLIAVNASELFQKSNPKFPEDHWNWKEVRIDTLITNARELHGLSGTELDALMKRLEWAKASMEFISYSRFCLFIGEAVHKRFRRSNEESERDVFSKAVDCYLT